MDAKGIGESIAWEGGKKDFPTFAGKILPAAFLFGFGFLMSGCHSSTALVEAGSTRHPVVAPAGTVLRVRLNQALDTGRSRPGDRFLGALDSPVVVDGIVILPKGAAVRGEVVQAYQPESGSRVQSSQENRTGGGKPAQLALAIESCDRGGQPVAVSATTATRTTSDRAVSRTSGVPVKAPQRIHLPADAIVGFTLREPISD